MSELVNYSTGVTVASSWLNRAQLREEGLATYVVYLTGGTVFAKALFPAGTDYSNADASTTIQNAITALPATGGRIIIRGATYSIATQLSITKPLHLQGEGSGFLWNNTETAPTELKWTGAANNSSILKVADQTEGLTLENLKLFYSGSTTGTDGIFFDGTTFNRHHILRNVNFQNFSGYGLHAQKSTFDVKMYGGGFFNQTVGGLGNVFIEASTGTPSQFEFFGVNNIINIASVYAITCQAGQCAWYGGNIANGVSGGNGLDLQGVSSVLLAGVDVEGATVASTIGIRYTGSGLKIVGGRIITWATGLQVGGATPSAQAINWDLDTNFSGNTTEDVKITAGGARIGRIREISENTLTTVTNLRATSDGVYTDLKRYKMVPQGVAAVSPSASPWTYQNQDFVPETVYLDGARGAAGTLTVAKNSITCYSITNSEKFHLSVYLEAGESMVVTYTSGAGDTLTANKDRK